MELAAIATVLAALGGVLKLVLDHLRRQTDQFTESLDRQQIRQETFLGNHMSKTVAALEGVSRDLQSLHTDNADTKAELQAWRKEVRSERP